MADLLISTEDHTYAKDYLTDEDVQAAIGCLTLESLRGLVWGSLETCAMHAAVTTNARRSL